jgi:hypothetical protein
MRCIASFQRSLRAGSKNQCRSQAQTVLDLDVLGLLGAGKRLQEGHDLMGNELKGKPRFYVGSQIQIRAKRHDFDLEAAEMEREIALGANFFITSSVTPVSTCSFKVNC